MLLSFATSMERIQPVIWKQTNFKIQKHLRPPGFRCKKRNERQNYWKIFYIWNFLIEALREVQPVQEIWVWKSREKSIQVLFFFEVFGSSRLWSKERNPWYHYRITYKLVYIDWDLDGTNSACSLGKKGVTKLKIIITSYLLRISRTIGKNNQMFQTKSIHILRYFEARKNLYMETRQCFAELIFFQKRFFLFRKLIIFQTFKN